MFIMFFFDPLFPIQDKVRKNILFFKNTGSNMTINFIETLVLLSAMFIGHICYNFVEIFFINSFFVLQTRRATIDALEIGQLRIACFIVGYIVCCWLLYFGWYHDFQYKKFCLFIWQKNKINKVKKNLVSLSEKRDFSLRLIFFFFFF